MPHRDPIIPRVQTTVITVVEDRQVEVVHTTEAAVEAEDHLVEVAEEDNNLSLFVK